MNVLKTLRAHKESKIYKVEKYCHENQSTLKIAAAFFLLMIIGHSIGFSVIFRSASFWTLVLLLSSGLIGGITGIVLSYGSFLKKMEAQKNSNPAKSFFMALALVFGIPLLWGFMVGSVAGLSVGVLLMVVLGVFTGNFYQIVFGTIILSYFYILSVIKNDKVRTIIEQAFPAAQK